MKKLLYGSSVPAILRHPVYKHKTLGIENISKISILKTFINSNQCKKIISYYYNELKHF